MKAFGSFLLMLSQAHVEGGMGPKSEGYTLEALENMRHQIGILYGQERVVEAERMVPLLVSALESHDEETVSTAANALGLFGCHAHDALPVLRAALSRFKIHEVPLVVVTVAANGGAHLEIEAAMRRIEADISCRQLEK